MGLFSRQQKTSIDKRQTLHAVPLVKSGVSISRGESGLVSVTLEIKRGRGFLDRFRPLVTEKTYELDEFGTFVIDTINGKTPIIDIAREFQKRFSMSRRECELGVVAFVKLLLQRQIIDVTAEGGKAAS